MSGARPVPHRDSRIPFTIYRLPFNVIETASTPLDREISGSSISRIPQPLLAEIVATENSTPEAIMLAAL